VKPFLLLLPLPLLALVNLGEMGTTYPITEKDISVAYKEGMKKLDFHAMRQSAINSIEAAKTVSADIPACVQSKSYDHPYLFTYTRDITDIEGKVLHRKGETVTVESKAPRTLCIVDGRTPDALDASLKLVTAQGKCDKTMIAGGSVDLLLQRGVPESYPYSPSLAQALGASCYPARITVKGTEIYFGEYGVAK